MAEEKVEPTLNRAILNQETRVEIMTAIGDYYENICCVDDSLRNTEQDVLIGEILNAIKVLAENKELFEQNQVLQKPFTTRIRLENGTDSFTTADGILEFIAEQRPKVEKMFLIFEKADDEVKTCLNTLGLALYGKEWAPKAKAQLEAEEVNEDHIEGMVSLYKAKSDELAIRFRNKAARDSFYATLPKGNIPQKFIKEGNRQFEKNKDGATPICHEVDSNVLHYPSYQAENGEFAINCANKENRDMLIAMLSLNQTERDEIRTIYGGLFAAYHNKFQATALYFNKENKVFAEHDKTYLKINTKTGEISQHAFKSDIKENIAIEEQTVEHKEPTKVVAPQISEVKEVKDDKKEKNPINQLENNDECTLKLQPQFKMGQDGYQLEITFAQSYICEFWYAALKNQFGLDDVVDISSEVHEVNSRTVVIDMTTHITKPGIYFKAMAEQFFSKSPLLINLGSKHLIDFFIDSLNLPKETYTKSDNQQSLAIPLFQLSGGLKSSVNLGFIQEALVVESNNLGPDVIL